MAELEIIGSATSNYVWACRIACLEKGVTYRHVPAMPRTPEVNAIHPLGKVPVMRHGDVTLGESQAICAYIDRTFSGRPLIPSDAVAAAQVTQWVSLVNTSIDPVWIRTYVRAYVRSPAGKPDRTAIDEAVVRMVPQMAAMERAVAGGHLVGDEFTLADINFMPVLFYARRFPEGAALVARHPHLHAYFTRHIDRHSIRETMPQDAPGAEPGR